MDYCPTFMHDDGKYVVHKVISYGSGSGSTEQHLIRPLAYNYRREKPPSAESLEGRITKSSCKLQLAEHIHLPPAGALPGNTMAILVKSINEMPYDYRHFVSLSFIVIHPKASVCHHAWIVRQVPSSYNLSYATLDFAASSYQLA